MYITKYGMATIATLVKPETKNDFLDICRELGINPTAFVRNHIEKFVKEQKERKE